MFVVPQLILPSVKFVPHKILITYHSMGGNTKELAKIISQSARDKGIHTFVSELNEELNIEEFDFVFIGSYTWGNGDLPIRVREYLKWLLKENEFKLPVFSVFGTGDTQWTHYCRAVDEIAYHLNKKTKVISKLKIEQHPVNQVEEISRYVATTLKEETFCR